MYCIYRITNKLNGKTYIGQHKYKDLSEDKYMGSGKYLWRSIEKYGIENFEREILISEIETRKEINKLEIEYINSERENGHGEYNISRGGDGGWFLPGENNPLYGKHQSEEHRKKISEANKGENNPRYGKHHTEDAKKKISEVHKGKHLPEETKRKISEALKGKNNPLYGKHHSEETRKKISEANKGKSCSEETRKKISEANKGKRHSEESRKRMSESMKGKHHSEEHIRKLSESHKYRIGKRYYNNGIECHMYIPGIEPEGYTLGKLSKIKEN